MSNKLEATFYNPVPEDFIKKAKECVVHSLRASLGQGYALTDDDLRVVWFSKVLQNWKAVVITDKIISPRGWLMYFEVTYNGDNNETYVDRYEKVTSFTISDSEYVELYL